MSTIEKQLLENIRKEALNSIFYKMNHEIKLAIHQDHDWEFVIIDKTINRCEIFLRFNSKIMTIVEFTSLTQFRHQFCLIKDLELLFTKAFKNLYEVSE